MPEEQTLFVGSAKQQRAIGIAQEIATIATDRLALNEKLRGLGEREQALYAELSSLVSERPLIHSGFIPATNLLFDQSQKGRLTKVEYGKAVVRAALNKISQGRTREILEAAEIIDPDIEKGQIYSAINFMFREKELEHTGSRMSRVYSLRKAVPVP